MSLKILNWKRQKSCKHERMLGVKVDLWSKMLASCIFMSKLHDCQTWKGKLICYKLKLISFAKWNIRKELSRLSWKREKSTTSFFQGYEHEKKSACFLKEFPSQLKTLRITSSLLLIMTYDMWEERTRSILFFK